MRTPELTMASSSSTIQKKSDRTRAQLTILLLDWQVRERFFALDWLNDQTVQRDRYEVLWVELYDRVVPEVVEKVDGHYTMGQKGMYHKHKGYNLGLLEAQGRLFCVCDSDAVFPPDFVESIFKRFDVDGPKLRPQVLMHYEYRTPATYPEEGLASIEDLRKFEWRDLWPNVGACMTAGREDAIRLGGFDEDKRYRGYMCGPYDLGWRLINAGQSEHWHDPSVALWHFAHPDPTGTTHAFSLRLWREIAHPHFDGHAAEAVEALGTGRLLPLRENARIRAMRLSQRRFDSELEAGLAGRVGPTGLSGTRRFGLRLMCLGQGVQRAGHGARRRLALALLGRRGYAVAKRFFGRGALRRLVRRCVGDRRYAKLKRMCGRGRPPLSASDSGEDQSS